MPLSYGTVTSLPRGTYKFAPPLREKTRQGISLVSFLRIFVTIAELGLSMLPGVGTVAQIGIGLGAATANTALSVQSGSLSGLGLAIDYGSAFIPALMSGRFIKKTGKVFASEEAAAGKQAVFNQLKKQSKEEFTRLEKSFTRYDKMLIKYQNKYDKAVRDSIRFAKRLQEGTLNSLEKATIEANIKSDALFAKLGPKEAEKALDRIIQKYGVNMADIRKQTKEWEELFSAIESMPIAKRASKSEFINELKNLSGKKRFAVIRDIYINPLRSGAVIEHQARRIEGHFIIKQMLGKLSPEGKSVFSSFLTRISALKMTKKTLEKEVTEFMEQFTEMAARRQDIYGEDFLALSDINSSELYESLSVFAVDGEKSAWRRFVKNVGSSRFNQKVVQKAQLIDPNDMGRAPIEWAYQKLRKKIADKLERSTFKNAARRARKALKSAADIEEAFVKAGGVLMMSGTKARLSRYILGYKVMPGGTPLSRYVVVKFNKRNTEGKGKNAGGKKDIIIRASDRDLELLATQGTSYWWEKKHRGKWWINRGGKRVATGIGTISTELSLFLSFVPIPALRNIQSIVSNWVSNAAHMSKGDYFSTWLPKFERAFVRSLINRSVRLGTRVVVGGLATRAAKRAALNAVAGTANKALEKGALSTTEFGKLISTTISKAGLKSAWVGRELQRLSMATLSTYEGKDAKGYFKFTDGSKNLIKKLLLSAAPVSLRGALTRKSTRVARGRGSRRFGRQLIGAKRNLSIMSRSFSSVTPPGVKGLRDWTKLR